MQGMKIEQSAADGGVLFRFTLSANGIEKKSEVLFQSPSNWLCKGNEGDWRSCNLTSLVFILEFDFDSIREAFLLAEQNYMLESLANSFPFSKIAAHSVANMGWYWTERAIGWMESRNFVPDAALLIELEKAAADSRFGQSPSHRLRKLIRALRTKSQNQ